MATTKANTTTNNTNTSPKGNNPNKGAPSGKLTTATTTAPITGFSSQIDFAAYTKAVHRGSAGYAVGFMDLVLCTLANATAPTTNKKTLPGSAANPLLCSVTIPKKVVTTIQANLATMGKRAPAVDFAALQGTHKLYLCQLVAADFGKPISAVIWGKLLQFGQHVTLKGTLFGHLKASQHTLASVLLAPNGANPITANGAKVLQNGLSQYAPAQTRFYTEFFNTSALHYSYVLNKCGAPANSWQATANAKRGAGVAHAIAACFSPARQPGHLVTGRGTKKSLLVAYITKG